MISERIRVYRKTRFLLALVIFVAACWTTAQSVYAVTQDPLKAGDTTTHEIQGGTTHSFTISLTQGQLTEIRIEQRGATLRATLFDFQGREVIEMDYAGGGFGPIYISPIASASGNYSLQILSVNPWANPAKYDLTVTSPRTATPADESVFNAQLEFSKGGKYFRAGNFTDTITAYQNSLKYWQSSGDLHWQAATLYALSGAYGSRNRAEAQKSLVEALSILDAGMAENDWRLKASALNDLGLILGLSERSERGFNNLNAALDLYSKHGDRRGRASALANLGRLYFDRGDLFHAREVAEEALSLRRAENDLPGMSNMLNAFSVIADRLAEPEQALAQATQALDFWKKVSELTPDDRARVAAVINNIAAANDKLGRWDQVFELYDQALEKYDQNDPRRAATLDNKGELYAALGDYESARRCYDQALQILTAAGLPDVGIQASVLVHIGQVFTAQRDLATAISYFEKARNLVEQRSGLTNVLTNLATARALNGELEKAIDDYKEVLKRQVEAGDKRGQALVLQKRGEAYAKLGKANDALNDFNQALEFWRAVKDRRGEAATLNNIALAERDRGNFEAALARSAEAIQVVESLRSGISNRQLRASYFAGQQNYYELDIDLKMQLSRKEKRAEYLAAALESAERSRARVLLDTLNEAALNRGDDKEDSNSLLSKLKKERAAVLSKLSAKNDARTRMLSGKYLPEQIAIFDREISQLSNDADVLEARIRSQDPRFAGLTKPQPARLKEIQEQLDSDTLLIEYFLGQTRSYVWLVTRDSIDGFELPARADVETLARRVYDSLSARGRGEKNETDKLARIAKTESDFADSSSLLSEMILSQIGARLGQNRLVIVADGALQTLPFGVLPAPKSSRESKDVSSSLIASNEIVSLPSASVLVLQRRELAKRKPAPLPLAVLADPVFDDKDSRVADSLRKLGRSKIRNSPGNTTSPQSSAEDLSRNSFQTRAVSGVSESGGIRRLPYSLKEANEIIAATKSSQTFRAVDFEASRATAMSPQLSKYRIVHLATHGVMNLSRPELSGVLFSMVDNTGQPTNGYLGLSEIYNLNLPADLVVLSACETGIGKEIKGEGLIALTRGFMHAGAERVVASLWKVDDTATETLMAEFYRQMFTNRLKPAAALRAAQLRVSQQPAWRKPHFWAGFILQGEWR